ncbi:MAG: hypothetical protein CM15mP70_16650 [Pelagibacteraceae bacterium]|nr:MAG: hypothetical protein CM15mP70_16650 [Pelagibacteraceae bacterium]
MAIYNFSIWGVLVWLGECDSFSKTEWGKTRGYRGITPVKDGLLGDDVIGVTGYFKGGGPGLGRPIIVQVWENTMKKHGQAHTQPFRGHSFWGIHVGSRGPFPAPPWQKNGF